MSWLESLKKRFGARAKVFTVGFTIFLIVMTLIDEVVKEGYVFNFEEIFTWFGYPSHEQIIVGLAVALVAMVVKWRKKDVPQ